MEELRSEDLEDMVQELDGEAGAQESLPQEVEEHLQVLQSGNLYLARQNAAEQLGKVGTSSSRIVRALITAYQSDSYADVSRAASKSLRARVHQEYMEQHPDLMEATQKALRQRPRSHASGEPTELEVYLPVIVGIVAALAGKPYRHAGGRISGKKAGYRTSDKTQALSYRLGAALGALYVRIRRSLKKRLASVAPGEPEALGPQVGRRPSPVHEGDQPSDCTACGAWNPPGSEHCGDCGAALADAEA